MCSGVLTLRIGSVTALITTESILSIANIKNLKIAKAQLKAEGCIMLNSGSPYQVAYLKHFVRALA